MKTVDMHRKFSRMIVEEGLRRRAEARREAEREAQTAKLLEIVNENALMAEQNAFIAEQYARQNMEDMEKKARRAEKRAMLAKLRRRGAGLVNSMWAAIGAAAVVGICYALGALPISAAVIAGVCCCISLAVCTCCLWKNAGEIAEVMNGGEK